VLRAEIAKLEGHRGAQTLENPYTASQHAHTGRDDGAKVSPSGSRRAGAVVQAEAAGAKSPALARADSNDGPSVPKSGPKPHPRWEAPQQQPDAGTNSGSAVETALWPGTALSAADPMRDQWAFRPKEAAAVPSGIKREPEDEMRPSSLPASLDNDLAMVQRKIKALAEEVNAAELDRDKPSGLAHASAIDKSIGALKATADSMREGPSVKRGRKSMAETARPAAPVSQPMALDLFIPASAERIAVSEPGAATAPVARETPPLTSPSLPGPSFAGPSRPAVESSAPSPANARLATIVAAIENGEMDVFLSPIVALHTHQVSHYDVTVRLKNTRGDYLDGAEQELQLASSDMLALFDTARLKRAAALADKLDSRGKSGSLVNGPSLTNGDFLETFARAYEERDRISNQLVLTFTQADVEMFSASAWQALSNMHAFGFRFAVAQIDHVAMDFAALSKRGFSFLRLEADALMNGLPARDRFIGPDELCRMLAGAGMTLVADSIEDEAVRARVFGFGVLLGQGRLFGGARQIKLDPLPAGSSAAA
jgi:cyclic-di-GMP phosphodiesterase TipF (flagellum assembly factor)